MQKITPCLWFDTEAEEAAEFYVSLFGDAKILEVTHYGDAGPRPAGTVMTVSFVLEGQEYLALNGGPEFPFTEAVSFSVSCEDQDEVDRLTADGRLAGYRYLPATRADLLRRLGRRAEAATAYEQALTLTDNEAERAFLTGRRDETR
jgi:uncharacterized glyoxalase superfamily protein PhnB